MTNGTKGERGDFFLPLGTTLKPKWRAACEEIGISQIKAGKRLIEWFVSQPKSVKLRALGIIDDDEPGPVAARPKHRTRPKRR